MNHGHFTQLPARWKAATIFEQCRQVSRNQPRQNRRKSTGAVAMSCRRLAAVNGDGSSSF